MSSSQNWPTQRDISMHFRVFLRGSFWVLLRFKISNIFRVLDIPDISSFLMVRGGGGGVKAASLRMKKK